ENFFKVLLENKDFEAQKRFVDEVIQALIEQNTANTSPEVLDNRNELLGFLEDMKAIIDAGGEDNVKNFIGTFEREQARVNAQLNKSLEDLKELDPLAVKQLTA